jgi:hypothetical protein
MGSAEAGDRHSIDEVMEKITALLTERQQLVEATETLDLALRRSDVTLRRLLNRLEELVPPAGPPAGPPPSGQRARPEVGPDVGQEGADQDGVP